MVEECPYGESARHYVVGGKVEVQCAGARCGLGVGSLDAAYQRLCLRY